MPVEVTIVQGNCSILTPILIGYDFTSGLRINYESNLPPIGQGNSLPDANEFLALAENQIHDDGRFNKI
jgi:hypothetical protein